MEDRLEVRAEGSHLWQARKEFAARSAALHRGIRITKKSSPQRYFHNASSAVNQSAIQPEQNTILILAKTPCMPLATTSDALPNTVSSMPISAPTGGYSNCRHSISSSCCLHAVADFLLSIFLLAFCCSRCLRAAFTVFLDRIYYLSPSCFRSAVVFLLPFSSSYM